MPASRLNVGNTRSTRDTVNFKEEAMSIAVLDSETLGLNRNNSIVTDIGVIIFDPETEQETRIGIRPNITEQLLLGQKCYRETVKFHEQHIPGGYEGLLAHLHASDVYEDMRIRDAHKRLKAELDKVDEIWINGLSFDPVVLENLFALVDLKLPYFYRKEVDVRSIYYRVLPGLRKMLKVEPEERAEPKHDALADAAWNLSVYKEFKSYMARLEGITANVHLNKLAVNKSTLITTTSTLPTTTAYLGPNLNSNQRHGLES
jgi:hypothetical protein